MEKTLAEIAREAWHKIRPSSYDDWQAVADAVMAEGEARRWKAIESAPKDGTAIDVWSDGCRHCDVEWAVEKKAWATYGYDSMEHLGWHVLKPQPTHWTPIPAPPKEASDASV